MTGYTEHEDAVQAINRGQVYYYLLKPWRTEELLQILRNAAGHASSSKRRQEDLLEELQDHKLMLEPRVADRTGVGRGQRQLQRALAEMEKLALSDPLTGLLNRRAIEDVAVAELTAMPATGATWPWASSMSIASSRSTIASFTRAAIRC